LKIEAIKNAKFDVVRILLDKVNNQKLVPIIYSHGLASSCAIYSAHLRELASHGYIVFGIDHQDESCGYTETREGVPTYFDVNKEFYDLDLRSK
jgi:predicted dienelactone hydrolase